MSMIDCLVVAVMVFNCMNDVLQEWLFFARVTYDLVFFFVVVVVVPNLILGIVIDTFADLRSEKQSKDEDLRKSCFICGLFHDRYRFC